MSKNYKELEKLKQTLWESTSICILSHINPDGDSIGSLLGLGIALKKLNNIDVKLIATDSTPNNLSFLPKIELIEELDINENHEFDVLITLDCSDLDRLGDMKWVSSKCKCLVNIDHHVTNDKFGNINIIDSKASSTGEIVYDLLEYMNLGIDIEVATCIYVAISSDTGSFKYDNTSSKTHLTASKLLKFGIDRTSITVNLYQSRSLEKTRLLISALNTLELYFNNKFGIVSVTQKMLKETNTTIKDVDGIIELIRDIDEIEVACVIKEEDNNRVKVGFRSKNYVDVAKIATIFNGGGHTRASGCTIFDSISSSKEAILKEIQKILG